jgi:wyosine [tRNA(Phe)-imidazoG37] synthetase (radical SAM superfamily)
MNHIFGPVNSRRFGISLGVDLSPERKQCNFDCLYCELEPAKTVDEQTSVTSVHTILEQIKTAIAHHEKIDVITITANGEPTLYPHLDELIEGINTFKGHTQTLILSNGSTVYDHKTANTLKKFDQVKLSLDCALATCLKKLDRAHQSITIDQIKEGIINFSKIFDKTLYIEILFVKTLNDSNEELQALNQTLQQIKATRIDIGTIDRPPAYHVTPLTYFELYTIAQTFDPSLPVHITTRKAFDHQKLSLNETELLQTLHRRALTLDDINTLFDQKTVETFNKLENEQKIEKKSINGVIFYKNS